MAAKREAEELLMIEEADAWFEYLETTRSQAETRYHEIEPWAWRLRAMRAALDRSGLARESRETATLREAHERAGGRATAPNTMSNAPGAAGDRACGETNSEQCEHSR